ncbi:MAG: RNA polymerase sigma factor [Lawsonibacter sp.]|jgi:RNA polymerase sigma factor (sigma-70 family)
MDPAQWMQQLAQDDPDALARLLGHFDGMFRYIIGGILEHPQEREECLAQVAAKLWEHRRQYDPAKSTPATWLTALCRNTAFDHLRRLRRAPAGEELPPAHPDPNPGPEETLLRQERTQALVRALNTLNHKDYQLFYRKYFYLQSTQRIADELGTTPRAVEGRLYRIRKRLQAQLGGVLE